MSQRASDADRERAVALLQEAFADGRLREDELRARIEQALHATTLQALAAVTHDVAAPPTPTTPAAHKGRHGEQREAGLRPTDERFRDPSTKRVMRVWLTPTGERRYLPD